jgi:hypothetical protein
MENFSIEKGNSTPYINFDFASRTLTFKGESFPENSSKFYEPVTKWIDEYFTSIGDVETVFEFEIIYFNSSTSKIFMGLFSSLDSLSASGKKIKVNWRASEENETAIECGNEFKEDLDNLEFNIIVI